MRRVLAVIIMAVVCCAGCMHLSSKVEKSVSGPGLHKPAGECVAYFESFSQPAEFFITGTPGDLALGRVGDPEENGKKKFAGRKKILFDAITNMALFNLLTDYQPVNYDLVIKGSLHSTDGMSFWTQVQIFDLWAHALVLPTLPFYPTARCEFRIYDRKGAILRAYVVRVTERYYSTYGGMAWGADYFRIPKWMPKGFRLDLEKGDANFRRTAAVNAVTTCLELMHQDLSKSASQ